MSTFTFKHNFKFKNQETNLISQDGKAVSSQTVITQRAIKRNLKNLRLGYKMAKSLIDLVGIYPSADEEYVIITEKRINAFALVLSLIEEKIIDEIFFSIYRINEPTVASLISFIEAGKINKGGFVVSNFFSNSKTDEKWALKLKDYVDGNPNFSIAFIHNHSKIMCLKAGDNFYFFEGSGNMSDNARIEQYRFGNSKEIYDFHKNWMLEAINFCHDTRT